MKFASIQKIAVGAIGIVIAVALFELFDNFAKIYDKKHTNVPRTSGHYMTPKASYNFSRGELIFELIYFFAVIPALIIVFLVIWNRLF